MSLLWVDGFEKYGDHADTAIANECGLRGKYGTRSWEHQAFSAPGRYGGGAWRPSGANPMLQTPDLGPNGKTLIVGFNFYLHSLHADAVDWCWLVGLRHPGQEAHNVSYCNFNANIVQSANQTEIELRRGDTQIAVSSTANLSLNTWYSFQMKVYCDNSSGTCNVKIDDTEVISFSGDTAHRTGASGHEDAGFGHYSRVMLRMNRPSSISYDDFFIMDGSGNTNNDFLESDFRVEALSPTSDASGNWSSTGANRYDQIDEDTLNESKYLTENTSGNQAVFETTNLSSNAAAGTIHGMMLNCEGKINNRLNTVPKYITQNGSGGSIQDGDDVVGGLGTYMNRTTIMEDDPDGNAWSASTVNDFRMGVELK